MRLAIVSDTHMPKGGRRLPDECVRRLHEADLILHAGDLATLAVLRLLEAIGPPVRAIHGNVDDAAVRAVLPSRLELDLPDGARLAMIHDSGSATGRLQRMRRAFPEAQAVVFGHSHLPLHEQAPDGFQILNPGSPTERRRAPRHTMGEGTVRGGRIELSLVELD